MKYVDFHTHFLPDMDDGAKDVEKSYSMLKKMADEGVDVVFGHIRTESRKAIGQCNGYDIEQHRKAHHHYGDDGGRAATAESVGLYSLTQIAPCVNKEACDG